MNIEDINLYNAFPSGIVAANEDLFNGDPSSDVVSMAEYQDALFFIVKNAGATGTADITVESCDDTTPTNTTAVAFRYKAQTSGNATATWTAAAAAGFTTTAGADQSYLIWVRADQLSGTDQYVRMVATENTDSPVDGAMGVLMLNPRHSFDGNVDVTS